MLTKTELLASGTWLNVIGYVQDQASVSTHSHSTKITPDRATVQAILLWDAGPLKLEQYERAVEHRLTS